MAQKSRASIKAHKEVERLSGIVDASIAEINKLTRERDDLRRQVAAQAMQIADLRDTRNRERRAMDMILDRHHRPGADVLARPGRDEAPTSR